MNQNTLERIRQWLEEAGISFREIHHQPTYTSEESAAARNEPLEVGGKSLLLKVGGEFKIFVLPADRKLNSVAIREYFHVRQTRFATREELLEITGLVPGSVPPFGEPNPRIGDLSRYLVETLDWSGETHKALTVDPPKSRATVATPESSATLADIEQLSEDEALEELLRELDD